MGDRVLGVGEQAEIRARYRHMLAEDAAVWRRYLGRGDHGFVSVWYDIHVGTAMKMPQGAPEYLAAVADGVSRKRIDVVARKLGVIWVIELKPICGAAALGQVLLYRDLFSNEFRRDVELRAVVICLQVEVDVYPTTRREGVEVIALDGVLY